MASDIEHETSPAKAQPPSDAPSGNSSLVSKPKRRGRNASACSQCHNRKQKCSGGHPCQNCVRRSVGHLCSGPPMQNRQSALRKQKQDNRAVSDRTIIQPSSATSQAIARTAATVHAGRSTTSQPRIGQLWRSRGAPAFFGNSYFGPQVAATMIDSQAPDIPAGTGSSKKTFDARPFRDESGPFSQIWDLLGLLPRQKTTVDHLVDRFLNDVNIHIDAVHPTSFKQSYVQFWERKSGFDDVTTVDLRWLALLFVILAISAYLECPRMSSPEMQRDYEESSLRFYWASRRAIVLAPSFYGESTDLVRAGILITRYLIQTQRLAESWLTVGFAARLGIAQGLHVDGEKWGLPRRSTETRRRLWGHLYTLDRMISLALGRPYVILDAQSLFEEPQNVFVDDFTDQEAESAQPLPVSNPTISVMSSLEYRLAQVIGQIQEACFQFHTASYRDVLALDEKLISWRDALPSYFALSNPDTAMDTTHKFLGWQRLYLHTNFHFARITLHRPYLLRHSLTDRYQFSRDACLSSARADLKSRLDHHASDSAEHYCWSLAAHQLFNSAIVLGILAVKEVKSLHTPGIVEDLEAYCEMQKPEIWLSEFGLAEIRVVEMCITKLKQQLRGARNRVMETGRQSPPASANVLNNQEDNSDPVDMDVVTAFEENTDPLMSSFMSPSTLDTAMTPIWQDQLFPSTFPGFTDLQSWQEVIDNIGADLSYDV